MGAEPENIGRCLSSISKATNIRIGQRRHGIWLRQGMHWTNQNIEWGGDTLFLLFEVNCFVFLLFLCGIQCASLFSSYLLFGFFASQRSAFLLVGFSFASLWLLFSVSVIVLFMFVLAIPIWVLLCFFCFSALRVFAFPLHLLLFSHMSSPSCFPLLVLLLL